MINFKRSSSLLSATAIVLALSCFSAELHAGREEMLAQYPLTIEGNDQLMTDAISTHRPESIHEIWERYKDEKDKKGEFLSSPEKRQAFTTDLATQARQYQKLCATSPSLYAKTAELFLWAIEFGDKDSIENLNQFLSQIRRIRAYEENKTFKEIMQICEAHTNRFSNPDLFFMMGQQYESAVSSDQDNEVAANCYRMASTMYYEAHKLKHEMGSEALYALPWKAGTRNIVFNTMRQIFEDLGKSGDIKALMVLAAVPRLTPDDSATIYCRIMSSETSTPEEKKAAKEAFYGLGKKLVSGDGFDEGKWGRLKPIYMKAAKTDPYIYVVICSLFENQGFFIEERRSAVEYYKNVVLSTSLTPEQKEGARKNFYQLSQKLIDWRREWAVPVYKSLVDLDNCPEFLMALARCYTGNHSEENYEQAGENYLKAEAAYLRTGETGAAGANEAREKLYSLMGDIKKAINRNLPRESWGINSKLRENRVVARKFFAQLCPIYEAEAMKGDIRLCQMLAEAYIDGELITADLGKALAYFIKIARFQKTSPGTYHPKVLGAFVKLQDDEAREQFKKLETVYRDLQEEYPGEKSMLLADLYLPAEQYASKVENPLRAVELYREAMHDNVPGASEQFFNLINRIRRFPSFDYFITCVEPLILDEARKAGDTSVRGRLAKAYEEYSSPEGLVRAAHLYAEAGKHRAENVSVHLARLMERASRLSPNERTAFVESFRKERGAVVNDQDKDSCFVEAQLCEWEGDLVKAITYYLKAARLGNSIAVSKVWDLYSVVHETISQAERLAAIETEFDDENPYAADLLARLLINDPRRQLDYDVKAARWGHPNGLEPAEKLYAEHRRKGLTNQTRSIFIPLLSYYIELRGKGDTSIDIKIASMHMDGIHVDARKAEEEKTAALEIYRKELSRLVTLVEAGDEEQTPQLNAVGELLRYAKLTQQQSITFLEPYFNFHLRVRPKTL